MRKELSLDFKFKIGDIVYLRTDSDQKKRIVTSIVISQSGIKYELSCATVDTWHYDFEMTHDIDVLIATTN
jgi:hypothetical protein